MCNSWSRLDFMLKYAQCDTRWQVLIAAALYICILTHQRIQTLNNMLLLLKLLWSESVENTLLQLKSWNYGHNKMSITGKISKICNSPYYWIDPGKSNSPFVTIVTRTWRGESMLVEDIIHNSTTSTVGMALHQVWFYPYMTKSNATYQRNRFMPRF